MSIYTHQKFQLGGQWEARPLTGEGAWPNCPPPLEPPLILYCDCYTKSIIDPTLISQVTR